MTEPAFAPPSRAGRAAAIALVLVFASAALLRFARLGADIPNDAEATNAPSLDAYWYLEGASARADGVVFEPCRTYDLEPWVSLARLWFALFGAGVAQACALGAAVGVATVVATWAWARPLGARAALVAALLLAVAFPAVQIARTPIIYGPVAMLAALAAALYVRGTWPWRAAAWALALALPVLLKAHAAALVVGLASAEVLRAPPQLRRRALAVVVIAVVAVGALLVVFDPREFVSANAARLKNYSAGSFSEGTFHFDFVRLFERALTLGAVPDWPPGSVGAARLAPALMTLGALGVALAWVDLRRLEGRAREALAIAAGFAVSFGLVAVPIEYRPVRYWVPVLPPLAVAAGYAVDRLMAGRPAPRCDEARISFRLATIVVAAVFGAIFAAHVLELTSAALSTLLPKDLWLAAIPAVVSKDTLAGVAFLGALLLVAAVLRAKPAPRALGRVVAIVLLSLASVDLLRDVEPLARPTFTMTRAQRVLRAILGKGAVLAGPYAPGLAIGTPFERRRGFSAGLSADGLRATGYTHFALDAQHAWFTKLEPILAASGSSMRLVAVLRVRVEPVLIYRFDWAEKAGYQLSPFEGVRRLEQETDGGDAAEVALERAGGARDRDVVLARVRALMHEGKWSGARAAAVAAVDRMPDDPEIARLPGEVDELSPK